MGSKRGGLSQVLTRVLYGTKEYIDHRSTPHESNYGSNSTVVAG